MPGSVAGPVLSPPSGPIGVALALALQRSSGNAQLSRAILARQATAPTEARTALLVEDGAETVEPTQMKRTAFLGELRAAIVATLNDQLATSPWRGTVDVSVDQMLASYREKSADALERAIRAEAAEAAACTDARAYIPLVCAHVRTRVQKEIESSPAPDYAAGGIMGAATAAAARSWGRCPPRSTPPRARSPRWASFCSSGTAPPQAVPRTKASASRAGARSSRTSARGWRERSAAISETSASTTTRRRPARSAAATRSRSRWAATSRSAQASTARGRPSAMRSSPTSSPT